MLFNFRRKSIPWEVVESSSVAPIPIQYDEEDDAPPLAFTGLNDAVGTYIFNISRPKDTDEFRRALSFSRTLLLQEVSKRGYNILLMESWQVTLLRRPERRHQNQQYRLEIRYRGRPAWMSGDKLSSVQRPPFIDILDTFKTHL